jgi:hypothetical protein
MIDEIKVLLGDAASNFTDAQIGLCIKMALAEVEAYCNRAIDLELEMIAERIAVLKLLRMNSEGLTSQSFSGVSENYIDGYPADILAVLNRKRKLKIV